MSTSSERSTLAFYEQHSRQYQQSTIHVDMEALYARFLRELRRGASILDAGCGSGRDSKAFAQRGFGITAIDASPAMARLATAFTGRRCEVMAFRDLRAHEIYDGIWACASLIHVPKREMDYVLSRFARALKPGGVLYISLKEGVDERTADDGRFVNRYTAEAFREVMANVATLGELAFWRTDDVRSSQHVDLWLNFLVRKAIVGASSRSSTA